MGAFLENFIRFVVTALWVLIFARILLSWVNPRGGGAISQFVIQSTEPILAPVRRLLPRSGMFDFSALIVLLVLGALMRAVG